MKRFRIHIFIRYLLFLCATAESAFVLQWEQLINTFELELELELENDLLV